MYAATIAGDHQVANYSVQLAHGKQLLLNRPKVMAIINLSSDSFSSQGRFLETQKAVDYACQAVADGADIIDIGAEPTNPSIHSPASEITELERLVPMLEALVPQIKVPISIDTSRPEVMQACLEMGAHLINDVRGLCMPGALNVAARMNAGICMMHMRYPDGIPDTGLVFSNKEYLSEIKNFLASRVESAIECGVDPQQIILDPGIGYGSFGKSTQQNCGILQNLAFFQDLGYPLLIGASRKTFIGEILQHTEDKRVAGSISAAVVAALQGAHILRVHDVRQTVDALKVARAIIDEGKINE